MSLQLSARWRVGVPAAGATGLPRCMGVLTDHGVFMQQGALQRVKRVPAGCTCCTCMWHVAFTCMLRGSLRRRRFSHHCSHLCVGYLPLGRVNPWLTMQHLLCQPPMHSEGRKHGLDGLETIHDGHVAPVLQDTVRSKRMRPPDAGSGRACNVFSCSGLTALPRWLGSLPGLRSLRLLGSIWLPAPLLAQVGLQEHGGRLSALPDSPGTLHRVQELDLFYCNHINTLPESLGALSELQVLSCNCWGLNALPEALGALSALQGLHLMGCSGLKTLPASLWALSSLQELRLRDCSGLNALWESLGALSGLRVLDLHGCSELTTLPKSLGTLSRLQVLSVYGCKSYSPETLQLLSGLRKLDLTGCSGLTMLPEWVGMLTRLTELQLQWCSRLTALPQSLGAL